MNASLKVKHLVFILPDADPGRAVYPTTAHFLPTHKKQNVNGKLFNKPYRGSLCRRLRLHADIVMLVHRSLNT